MTGEGVAAILVGVGTLAAQFSSIAMQWRSSKVSRANSDKLDAQATKIDDNTAVTQATAIKIDEVHAATAALVESTGTHQALKSE